MHFSPSALHVSQTLFFFLEFYFCETERVFMTVRSVGRRVVQGQLTTVLQALYITVQVLRYLKFHLLCRCKECFVSRSPYHLVLSSMARAGRWSASSYLELIYLLVRTYVRKSSTRTECVILVLVLVVPVQYSTVQYRHAESFQRPCFTPLSTNKYEIQHRYTHCTSATTK